MTDDEPATATDDLGATYGGLFGAFPYAFRASDSLLFKSYAVVGGLFAFVVAFLFGLAVVVLIGDSAGVTGGSFSFSRAFFALVGLLVVAPLVAPVLFVARHHRRGASDSTGDAGLAALGYCFVASLYVGLIVSTPASQQSDVGGALALLVEPLYALPAVAGLLPPLAVAVLIWLAGRRLE